MNYSKHVYFDTQYITAKRQDGTWRIEKLQSYVLDSVFGWKWLPNTPLFETNLVLLMHLDGQKHPFDYRSGSARYTADTLSHIAGFAAYLYSASKGRTPIIPTETDKYIEKFKKDHENFTTFPEQGFYLGKTLMWPGNLHKDRNLFTRDELRAWADENKLVISGI